MSAFLDPAAAGQKRKSDGSDSSVSRKRQAVEPLTTTYPSTSSALTEEYWMVQWLPYYYTGLDD